MLGSVDRTTERDPFGRSTNVSRADHILVVDDDADIRLLLQAYLQKHGYRVTTAANGSILHDLLARGERLDVDLVVLDLMLPGEDGFSLCRSVRSRSRLPILMLTARGEDEDRIRGLDLGADDYLVKPFHPEELRARVQSILRRARSYPETTKGEAPRVYRFAGWTLNTARRELRAPDGTLVSLTGTEYRLLHAFLQHPGTVLTREQLSVMVHARTPTPYDRSLDVQVSRLRRRLGDDGRNPRLLQSVRGQGYLLATVVEHGP
jgi:two-component system OmpR family response regulator